jgi:hypothetical protein
LVVAVVVDPGMVLKPLADLVVVDLVMPVALVVFLVVEVMVLPEQAAEEVEVDLHDLKECLVVQELFLSECKTNQ